MESDDKYAVVVRHYNDSQEMYSYKIIGHSNNTDEAAGVALSFKGYSVPFLYYNHDLAVIRSSSKRCHATTHKILDSINRYTKSR